MKKLIQKLMKGFGSTPGATASRNGGEILQGVRTAGGISSLSLNIRTSMVVIFGGLLLTGCGKTIEFTEEVEIPGSAEKILVKRKEIFEQRVDQLVLKQLYVGSELKVVGKESAVWKENLHPIFLGRLSDGAYLLVTEIPNSTACVKRGRPTSPYVAFRSKDSNWEETSLPREFDGAEANLLLGIDSNDAVKSFLSAQEIREFNRKVALDISSKKIILTTKFGC